MVAKLSLILSKSIRKLRTNPRDFYFFVKAFLKGLFYAGFYRFFRKNVRIKLPFFVYYKIRICGSGSVLIEKGCAVSPNAFDGLTITTFSTDAKVNIGKECNLGGVTIRCHKKIIIGDRALLANCLIQDALFSMTDSIDSDVFIGKDVWLSGQTIVLGDSNIGDGSVLGVGSVCVKRDIPREHLAIGNPVFSSVNIKRLGKIMENI